MTDRQPDPVSLKEQEFFRVAEIIDEILAQLGSLGFNENLTLFSIPFPNGEEPTLPPNLREKLGSIPDGIAGGSWMDSEVSHDSLLRVDKKKWYEALNGPASQFFLYFRTESLLRWLDRPTWELFEGLTQDERKGLQNDRDMKRWRILVGDADRCLTGDYLSVVGGASARAPLPSAVEVISAPRSHDPLRPDQVAAVGELDHSWLRLDFGKLAPTRFKIQDAGGSQPAADPVGEALRRHQALACLAYLADRSNLLPPREDSDNSADEPSLELEFLSREHRASLRIPIRSPWAPEAADLLYDWFRAAYDRRPGTDREYLWHLRAILARMLPPEGGLDRLTASLKAIEKNRRQSWKVLIEGKVDRFFGRLADVRKALDGAIESHRRLILDLDEALRSDFKGGVYLVLSSVLVDLMKPEMDAVLYAIGAALYLTYIIAFQWIFGLQAIDDREKEIKRKYENEMKEFRQVLGDAEVDSAITDSHLNVVKEKLEKTRGKAHWVYSGVVVLIVATMVFVYCRSPEEKAEPSPYRLAEQLR